MARIKILKLFLLNPNASYYIRQVARRLNLQLNAVRRELENLETIGLLTSHQGTDEEGDGGRTDRKFYQANQNFVLFQETRELIAKSQILCEKVFTEKLKKLGQIKLLVLAGLFLNDGGAPVDMLIVGEFNKDKVAKLVRELEEELVAEVNYALFNEEEFRYRQQVTDVFLYSVLESKKAVIVDEQGYLKLS